MTLYNYIGIKLTKLITKRRSTFRESGTTTNKNAS